MGGEAGGTLTVVGSQPGRVHRSPLIMGLAAVFAGLTTLLVAAGAATGEFFVLFVALPLGITTAVMWLHGTGRLRESVRRRAASDRFRNGRATVGQRSRSANRRTSRERTAGDGPFTDGNGPFTGNGGRFGGARRRRTTGRARRQRTTGGAGTAGGETGRTRGRVGVVREGMSAEEAARVLGVDPGADDATVKRAYREKVKRHHPDVDGGDAATFKRLTEAYERLA